MLGDSKTANRFPELDPILLCHACKFMGGQTMSLETISIVLAKNVAYPSLASSTALIDTRDQGAVRSRNAAYESCTLRVISPRAASSPSTSAETLRAASTTSPRK